MKLMLLTALFGILSAVVPIFNMEAYIVLAYARTEGHSALVMAAIGSLGQNVGKLAWFYAARGALNFEWLRRRLDDPKRQRSYERRRAQVEGRPVFSGVLTFFSAMIGFPPFFAMAMIAGSLRMNVVVFFVAGLAGRTLFFWAILAGVGLALH
jgi:membrane protein YqaA with SNARE-associated domain